MNTNPSPAQAVQLTTLEGPGDLPESLCLEEVVQFFHHKMRPYHDTVEDVRRGLEYAFSDAEGKGGFVILALDGENLVGGITILHTGMGGYVPEDLLLFVAVEPDRRNQGIGQRLIRAALARTNRAMKLHVEHDNPARRLYERVGFASKYLEMRLDVA